MGYGGAVVTPDLMDPTQLRDPRFRKAWNGPFSVSGGDSQDLLAPANTMPASSSEPAVQSPSGGAQPVPAADPLAGARQRVQDTSGALQSRLDEYADQPSYTPRPRSLPSRIGEAAVSMFSPFAARTVFEQPEQQRYAAYQAGEQKQGRVLGALRNAAQLAERDLQLGQQAQLQKAQIGWYDRRQGYGFNRTTEVMKDGQPHVMQYNDETGLYDKDAGVAPPKGRQAAQNEIGLFQEDPEAFEQYETLKNRIHSRYDRSAGSRPTSDESKQALYKKDPAAFNAIYGDKGAGAQGKSDDALMKMAVQMSKDELGDYDPDAALENFDKLTAARAKRQGGGQQPATPAPGGAQPTPPRQTQGDQGPVKYYRGKPYVKRGGQWVRSDAGPAQARR